GIKRHCAVKRFGDKSGRQRIVVRIVVVGEDIDDDAAVLRKRGRISDRERCPVPAAVASDEAHIIDMELAAGLTEAEKIEIKLQRRAGVYTGEVEVDSDDSVAGYLSVRAQSRKRNPGRRVESTIGLDIERRVRSRQFVGGERLTIGSDQRELERVARPFLVLIETGVLQREAESRRVLREDELLRRPCSSSRVFGENELAGRDLGAARHRPAEVGSAKF